MIRCTLRRVSAWGLVLTFGSSLVLPVVSARHLRPDPDEGAFFGGFRSVHVSADGGDTADEHCAICHWLRAISGAAVQGAATPAPWLAPASSGAARPVARPGGSPDAAGPSRAPPAGRL